jgi:hypothetical protein
MGEHRLVQECTDSLSVGKFIVFDLGEDYIKNSQIRLQYIGYATFSLPALFDNVTLNTISPFKVLAIYNSCTLATSDNAIVKSLRIYGLLTSAEKLANPVIVFFPTNEAEKATYNFTVEMSQFVELWEDDKIWIRFPSRYGPHLSRHKLQVRSELKGGLEIEVFAREVIITGFYA